MDRRLADLARSCLRVGAFLWPGTELKKHSRKRNCWTSEVASRSFWWFPNCRNLLLPERAFNFLWQLAALFAAASRAKRMGDLWGTGAGVCPNERNYPGTSEPGQVALIGEQEEPKQGSVLLLGGNEIKSSAVVKYSSAPPQAAFSRLQEKTDLKLPPANWLRESAKLGAAGATILGNSKKSKPFSSFGMAYDFIDSVGNDVDVVSDSETGDWTWLKEFYQRLIDQKWQRKKKSKEHWYHKAILSKFLYYRDNNKPINVLTGIDYWLDNLICNVPELVMCFHVNGIVQIIASANYMLSELFQLDEPKKEESSEFPLNGNSDESYSEEEEEMPDSDENGLYSTSSDFPDDSKAVAIIKSVGELSVPEKYKSTHQIRLMLAQNANNRTAYLEEYNFQTKEDQDILHSLHRESSCQESKAVSTVEQQLWKKSFSFFEKGIQNFESIDDSTNAALLLCNMGRLMRICAHAHCAMGGNFKREFSPEEALYYNKKFVDDLNNAERVPVEDPSTNLNKEEILKLLGIFESRLSFLLLQFIKLLSSTKKKTGSKDEENLKVNKYAYSLLLRSAANKNLTLLERTDVILNILQQLTQDSEGNNLGIQ
ncbi:erythroid differentiation-related factor 1 [Crotalus adamanteus]|uniref:Erythroid differentiation-related factor 1 n=1 Tax=Crotalus adamanteus TaxID=8729 RepID=A0AAW1BFU7_CROAD